MGFGRIPLAAAWRTGCRVGMGGWGGTEWGSGDGVGQGGCRGRGCCAGVGRRCEEWR